MGEKKGKALALELIDDLLNEKSDEVVIVKDAPKINDAPAKKPEVAGTVVHPAVPKSALPANDKTVELTAANKGEDRTVPLNDRTTHGPTAAPPTAPPTADTLLEETGRPPSRGEDRVRASVGRPGAFRSLGAANATEAALAQSESLRIAQGRVLELEQEIERLRLQNEELAAAGETLRRRTDELLAENSRREADYQHALSTFEQEKGILTGNKEALRRDVEDLKRKNEELELRISTNIQKIRVRERELSNRLELVKMEGSALIRAKDEMILDLKRQIDQLNIELTNYRGKNQELHRQTNDKQEMLRRTVKALRLALSMLEGEEEAAKGGQQRKAK